MFSDKASPELYLEGEDTSVLSVVFDNGVIGNVITNWATTHPGSDSRFAVYGTDGSVISEADGPVRAYSLRTGDVQPNEWELQVDPIRHSYQDGFGEVCREYVEWIQTGKDSPIHASESRKDLEIVEAGYLSAQSGQAVELPV